MKNPIALIQNQYTAILKDNLSNKEKLFDWIKVPFALIQDTNLPGLPNNDFNKELIAKRKVISMC